MNNKFYITTTLPYVNADPHLGFALEIIQADVISRYQQLIGNEVVFNTGTDEHGLKIYRNALEEKKDPKSYTDENATKFENLKKALNLSYTNFIRTTNPFHIKAAQEFWKRCDKNGDIYKAKYKIKYCVGCELEKTESELMGAKCPVHPNLKLEEIEEENYFFKFSKYQKPLLEFYEKNPYFIVPDFRFNEIKQFVKSGITDFSISRLKDKMPWGVPIPNDNNHVMYVWFDALVGYISTLGWPASQGEPDNEKSFVGFWGIRENSNALQIAGKDNLRQQSAMWQTMLMSAGLPNSKQILIHGFITSNGQKMSKSLGNVINPLEIVEKYGADALRYWLLSQFNPFEDIDFTWEKLNKVYNADLANGLGNLVARVAKLADKTQFKVQYSTLPAGRQKFNVTIQNSKFKKYNEFLKDYRFNEALTFIWEKISSADRFINAKQPWKLEGEELEKILNYLISEITEIGVLLQPFLPHAAKKIIEQFEGPKVKSQAPLFPRK